MSDEIIKKAEEYALKSGWSCIEEQLAGAEAFAIKQTYIDAYTQGRADALRWIPVSERQPEKSGKYLVSIFEGDCGSSLDYTAEQKGWNLNWLTGSREHEMFPTHWMELPLAPIKLPGGEND